ncbi:MAG TPA: hypothetical protein ENK66_10580 [Arcobacter sp.]|jgi:hypothetical protein|nr:hypothetical protein [Arcobacter sp.]
MSLAFLGYDYTITYDDFSQSSGLEKDLDTIKQMALSLENSDDTYVIEYKEKYSFENKFLYSEIETIVLENNNIPIKHRLINSFYEKAQIIYNNENNISNDELQDCINDLNKLMEVNN